VCFEGKAFESAKSISYKETAKAREATGRPRRQTHGKDRRLMAEIGWERR
jgi:hypothetical protein